MTRELWSVVAFVSVAAFFLLVAVSVCGYAAARALALPEGRIYEMVSPPYKGGYGVEAAGIDAVAPDGQSVVFLSLTGTFAGAPSNKLLGGGYLARRGEAGWSTSSLEPPASLVPEGIDVDFTPTLSSVLLRGNLGPSFGEAGNESPEKAVLIHPTGTPDIAANWQVFVVEALDKKHFEPRYEGASPDFCHVLLRPYLDGEKLLPEAVGTQATLYDLATGCGGQPPVLRLVGLNNKGRVFEPVGEEEGLGGGRFRFNGIADGGREIFFTKGGRLFVRLDGSRTVEVSRPLEASKPFGGCSRAGVAGEVPCDDGAGAVFWGASEDGSRVFFTTPARLTGEGDETNNLYMASIGCPPGQEGCEVSQEQVVSLVRVSRPAVGAAGLAGQAADVRGVVKTAPDGSRVYFVAGGVLSEEPGPEGRVPVGGAENLYVYDSVSGVLRFVADLCSGPGLSGTVADVRCPPDLERNEPGRGLRRNDTRVWEEERESQVNVCGRPSAGECTGERETGRFLVFSSYGRLLRSDTDNAKDIHRYDAQSGTLERVSVGEAGYDANGNCNDTSTETGCDASIGFDTQSSEQTEGLSGSVSAQRHMGDRAIDEDGSRIVFKTAAPLSPAASNGLANVYEWSEQPDTSEGGVSIVSSGSSLGPDEASSITPSGNDIFFLTSQGLVPQDTDGQTDVYDSCLNCPLPSVPAQRQPCSGDACQGPLTNPAPLLIPGSVSQTPGGNYPPPSESAVKAKKAKTKRGRASKGAKHAAKHKRKGRASGIAHVNGKESRGNGR